MTPASIAFYASYALLWIVILWQTGVIIELTRRATSPDRSVEERDPAAVGAHLSRGTPGPPFAAMDLATNELVGSDTLRGEPVLLGFVSGTCPTCIAGLRLMRFAATQTNAKLVVVCQGEADACRVFVSQHAEGLLALHDATGAIAIDFTIDRTPKGVLLDATGDIVKYMVPGVASDIVAWQQEEAIDETKAVGET